MKSELFNFENTELKVFTADDETLWFLANEVCAILEIKNPRDAIAKLDSNDKGVVNTDTLGGNQKTNIINEFGLYDLVFVSRTEKAKRFKRWLSHEVVPSIRKTGSYSSVDPLEALQSPEGIARLLKIAEKKIELEKEIKQLQPMVEYHQRVRSSDEVFPLSDFGSSSGIGRRTIFKFCREIGWMYFVNKRTVPYKTTIGKGLLVHKESEYKDDDGKVHQTHQVFITGKGKTALVDIYNRKNPNTKVSSQMSLM